MGRNAGLNRRLLNSTMLVVKDIDACYERAIAMNRRAGIVGVKLRAAIGRDARP
jgi:hypothetical protein